MLGYHLPAGRDVGWYFQNCGHGLAFLGNVDRWGVAVLAGMALFVGGWRWLTDHPQHNPWTPLDINDPPGWAT